MCISKLFISKKNILLLGLLLAGLSCHRFYMPVKAKTGTPGESGDVISSYNSVKYFILRQGEKNYSMKNIVVDKSNLTLTADLAAVDPSHRLYINAKGRDFQYSNKGNKDDVLEQADILNEIHIYIKSTVAIDATRVFSMPLDQVEKIEVIEHDQKRTSSSYVLGGVGIGLGVVVIAGIIVAATKSSCPFVSVYDGNQYRLQGELFGGAVNRQLERLDYIPLKTEPANGSIQLRISNELKERQFTNFADLLVIEHPKGAEAYIDTDGEVYQVAYPESPVVARLNNRLDVLNAVRVKDDVYCSFNDTSFNTGANEMMISFSRPPGSRQGKLLLHLKNSFWFDYLYGEFTRKFGSKYGNWQEKQQHTPAEKMIRWTEDQQIPLSISVQTSSGWKEIRKLKTIGPLANRSIVIPVELDGVSGKNVQLKLCTGFMFWEIDYAAMDFTTPQPAAITRLSPSVAVDENGNSVLPELTADDNHYLAQPLVGSYADLTYQLNRQARPGNVYSLILCTKGYYEPIREYSGKPDKLFLKKFKEPGELSRFSLARYRAIPGEETIIALNTR